MKNIFLTLCISIFSFISVYAQLDLIPTPQKIEMGRGVFEIKKNTKIVLNKIDPFYGEEILICIENELGLGLKLSDRFKQKSIQILKIESENVFKDVMSKNDLDSTFSVGDEGYVLSVTPKEIKIIAHTDAGIFYGIQTLKQLIVANRIEKTLPCVNIYDYPNFPVRAWQDDISRGPIPTMEMFKEQIKTMASFKQNYFHLYIEHVFKLDKHPGIAPEDGITKEQIDELSEYANRYHVKLIGSYQSFGHMAKTLSHPRYKHLAENKHIITPALEESYEFLDDVYSEIVPNFESDFFNINCDETFGLGEGKSKEMVDSLGVDGVYIYHINRLNQMLKKYDKKILMWGDIVTSYPESIKRLPKDITVMPWKYNVADNFEKDITPISEMGLNFWVAPGISCWSNLFPRFRTAEINIYNFIRDGYKHNASGVLNTSWDDGGLNFTHNNWHGFIWGAENSWKSPQTTNSIEESNTQRKLRYTSFNKAYDNIFYGLKQQSMTDLMIEFSSFHESDVRDILRNDRFFEPIFPIHHEYISNAKKKKNRELLERIEFIYSEVNNLKPIITRHNITIEYLEYALRMAQFTLRKNLLRIDIYHFLEHADPNTIQHIKEEIDFLVHELEGLKTEYIKLWNNESRKSWLQNNLNSFDKIKQSIADLEGYCMIIPSKKLSKNGRKITMSSLFGDLPVYFTTDKNEVNASFQKYTEPIYINQDIHLQARVVDEIKQYDPSEMNLIHHKAIGKLHKLNTDYSRYHPSYDAGGKYGLIDGVVGEQNLKSGKWQGYEGNNIDIELDLEKTDSFNSFSMSFFQNTFSWVIFPKKLEIFVKNTASEEYTLIKTISNTIPPEEEGALKQEFKANFNNVEARFIRVVAHNYGKLPEWHHAGSNFDSMLFADEIIIK